MTILVIGDGDAAAQSAHALRYNQAPVQCCRNEEETLQVLEDNRETYSLILLEHRIPGSRRLRRHLAEWGLRAPVIGIGRPADTEGGEALHSAMCGIERTADGCQRLRCALNEASAHPASHPGLADRLDGQSVAFAYNAPCGGRRQS